LETIDLNFVNNKNPEEVFEITDGLIEIFRDDWHRAFEQVKIKIKKETKIINLNSLFTGLIYSTTRFPLDRELTVDDLVLDLSTGVNENIANYLDDTILEFTKQDGDISELSLFISKALSRAASYSWNINHFRGNTINIYDLIKLMQENPDLREIINFESNENLQFAEIESSVEEQTKKLVKILRSKDVDSCFKNIIPSVSIKQFQQVFVNISLKPDLYGIIISKPINTSFFRGMRNSTDYYINAQGARKALVTNATSVRSAGYLARKLILLCLGTQLDREVEDCGTNNLIELKLDNKDQAKRFTNSFYKLKPSDKKLSLVTNKNYMDIIGKTVYFRSPITCKLGDGKICKTCYGHLSHTNKFHIGISAILVLCNQLIQRLLSSKHLLQVSTEKIELDETISKYFYVDKDILVAKENFKLSITEVTEAHNSKQVHGIKIVDASDEIVDYQFLDMEVFDSIISENLDKDNSIDVEPNQPIFKFNVENTEISAPLKKLLSLIESEVELNKRSSVNELLKDLIDLLNLSGIRLSATGLQILVKSLARDPSNIMERTTDLNNVYFLRVHNAILNSKSLSIGLAYERLKLQLESNIFDKTESSVLDVLF
jgi:hypothetical protein